MKTALFLFGLFALFACSTNPYRPYKNEIGYSDFKNQPRKYEVMYHGSDKQDELMAKQCAMTRAAEIAKRENYPYFRIDTSKTMEKQEVKSYETSDPYYGYYGTYGWGGWGAGYNMVTYTETHPVVRISFTLESSPCESCISAEEQILQAAASGIIPKDKG